MKPVAKPPACLRHETSKSCHETCQTCINSNTARRAKEGIHLTISKTHFSYVHHSRAPKAPSVRVHSKGCLGKPHMSRLLAQQVSCLQAQQTSGLQAQQTPRLQTQQGRSFEVCTPHPRTVAGLVLKLLVEGLAGPTQAQSWNSSTHVLPDGLVEIPARYAYGKRATCVVASRANKHTKRNNNERQPRLRCASR